MSEKCICKNPGWCERHQMMKVGKIYEICQSDTEQGEKFRTMWDANVGNNMIGKPNLATPCGCKGKSVEVPIQSPPRSTGKTKKLLLTNNLCPGDILVMSGAIECLHQQHNGKYIVSVQTSCDAIYENSPRVVRFKDSPDAIKIKMEYPLIHQSNQRPVHFLQGYVEFLAEKLNIKLDCTINKPYLFLSDEERKMPPQVEGKYWVINAGVKNDYTAKKWGHENYQKVVNELLGKIQFVQVGEKGHIHKPLDNVINMIGKTTARQLIRLCHKAEGGLGPITFIGHIFAAFQKPYISLHAGREQVSWENYPTQTTLSTIGTLPCCRFGGCWKSRVVPLNDGDPKDQSLCEIPVMNEGEMIPKCMDMISADLVCQSILNYYEGGILSFD